MFEWLFRSKIVRKLEEETKKGFNSVKEDMDSVGKWIKHLDRQNKQVFELTDALKKDLSSIKEDLGSLKERLDIINQDTENKQVFKKLPVVGKQTGVGGVGVAVQTPVQTANFFDILKELTSNEKLVVFTLLNSDLKLSYEDLALLLGKEKSTIRGQINNIKQKNEGLIKEIIEKNGKKRVFIPEENKEKLAKYAKVRVKNKKKR